MPVEFRRAKYVGLGVHISSIFALDGGKYRENANDSYIIKVSSCFINDCHLPTKDVQVKVFKKRGMKDQQNIKEKASIG